MEIVLSQYLASSFIPRFNFVLEIINKNFCELLNEIYFKLLALRFIIIHCFKNKQFKTAQYIF